MIGCIIQARMGSSRLPGKVMERIFGESTVLDFVLSQLSYSKKIEKIVVATTDLKEDDIISDYLESKNYEIFRGSSEDVLDRFFQCASRNSFDIIVRITADNPLIDPEIVDLVIEKFLNQNCDFVTNTLKRTFPYGTEVEVFTMDSLEKAWKNASKPSEREHVTPFIREFKNSFNLLNIESKEELSFLRYTIDRKEDLLVVKEIVKNITKRPIVLREIIELYDNQPEIFEINKNVKHDGFLSSLKKDEEFLKLQTGEDN